MKIEEETNVEENLTKEEVVKQILEKLEQFGDLSEEQQNYVLFKIFMNAKAARSELLDALRGKFDNASKWYVIGVLIDALRKRNIETKAKIDSIANTQYDYKNILLNTKELADELNLNNSLMAANLFTYLLWNGYFSKEKELKFQSHDRVLASGRYSQDIMSGIGVCLNFSDMLTDYINEFDYKAATLINYLGKDMERSYTVDIERKLSKPKLKNKLLTPLLKPLTRKIGNHAYTLINENNKFYIYDATNLIMGELKSKDEAILIPGKGTLKIKPYFSYYINLSDKSVSALDSLHEYFNLESPYNKKDFIITWEECLDLFIKNTNLLDDFYNEIRNSIVNVATINEQQKKKIKAIDRGKSE